MVAATPSLRMTYAEYLVREATAETKSEYLRGEVYAMAGGWIEHSRLAAAVTVALGTALAGTRCVVLSSDARVRVLATDRATYPDVTVLCGPAETTPDDPDGLLNPTVIVEVLSPSTEATDRGEKFAHYRRIPSLREYVLVSQGTPRIEVFRRDGDVWALREHGPGERAELASVGISIAVDDVYGTPAAA